MDSEKRKEIRLKDIGRVDAPEVCVFPGVLMDVSESGCKVRFSVPINPDLENEYQLKIVPSHKSVGQGFLLIALPMWFRQIENNTEIGFKFLHSPDTKQYKNYIEQIKKQQEEYSQEYFD